MIYLPDWPRWHQNQSQKTYKPNIPWACYVYNLDFKNWNFEISKGRVGKSPKRNPGLLHKHMYCLQNPDIQKKITMQSKPQPTSPHFPYS